MKTSIAIKITHTLSNPSKMPGWSYGLPALECKTGSKLRKVPGTPCYGCYALKGCYSFPDVKKAQYKRLRALAREPWTAAMAALINSKKSKWFRWHDSGDVQDLDHLNKIFKVCRLTPDTRHWLPTREAWTMDHVSRAPDNLIIRFSMPMVNQEPAGSWLTIGMENLIVKFLGARDTWSLVHASRVGSQCLVSGVNLQTSKILFR